MYGLVFSLVCVRRCGLQVRIRITSVDADCKCGFGLQVWIRITSVDSDCKCGFGLCADMDCCRKGLLCMWLRLLFLVAYSRGDLCRL